MNWLSALSLTQKVSAAIVVAALGSGAALGAFAAHGDLPGQASPTASAIAGANATGTPVPHATVRAIKGIPTDNPEHQAEATAGVCVRGETAVKTTPSGESVNVPCQAIDHTPGAMATDVASNRTPGAAATDAADNATAHPSGQSGANDGHGTAAKTAHAGGGQ